MEKIFKVGTRGSALALAQTQLLTDLLPFETEIVTIVTSGDRREGFGDKSRWIDSLETALLDGTIDLAAHSAKDVPGELAEGCVLLAAGERGTPYDAMVGASSVDGLPSGARVGTSSLRRKAQLLATRPDLRVDEIRGNVDTRLRRMAEGDFDAMVIAAAGLERIGRSDTIDCVLDGELFVPSPGQGILVLEGREGDLQMQEATAAINDEDAWRCLLAERALVETLGATCHTPAGAFAVPVGGDQLRLSGFVGLPDGSTWLRDELTGPASDAAALGKKVAERMIASGAMELLEQADALGLGPQPVSQNSTSS